MADDDSKSKGSQYPRRARYLPGMLLVSPVAVVVIAGGWDDARIVTVLLGAAGTIGLPLVLESFVRQSGHRYDVTQLAGSNGRWTTTNMLWPMPDDTAEGARDAQNRKVVEQVTGTQLPSVPPQSDADAATVEAALDAAVADVRARTRDHAKFEILADENAEYGMWRNLLGVRRYGIAVAAVAAVAAIVLIVLSITDTVTASTAELVVGLLVIAAIKAFWWKVPTERRVVQAAQRYALALLDAARLLTHTP